MIQLIINKLNLIVVWLKSRHGLWPIGLAMLGTFMIYKGMHDYFENVEREYEVISIIVAAHDLPQDQPLTENDISTQNIVKKLIPLGAITVDEVSNVIGKTPLKPVLEGELLLWTSFHRGFHGGTPSEKITKGFRGVTLEVNETSAVGFQVQHGDRVDLLVTLATETATNSNTITLLQNVTVLRVGAFRQTDMETYSSLTLMVRPIEAALIRHAETKGRITMSLRNPDDHVSGDLLPYIHDQQLFESAFREAIQNDRNTSVEIIKNINPSSP
ncbi:MAG: Flp pilus assembly protein CpaB [Bdellovibrionales bacterium]|nr:Flp pilus assembly protein CpaB [Bdellovibrionales bacterium]